MEMFKEFYRKNKAYFWIGLFIFCLFSYTWQLPHHIRYCIESMFGNTVHYIDECGIGVENSFEWLDSEYLENNNSLTMNISQYKKPVIYIYGTYVNSFDSVLIACNGEPIKADSSNSYNHYGFWERIYVEKTFRANLTNKKYGLNKIVVREGNAKKIYYVYLE